MIRKALLILPLMLFFASNFIFPQNFSKTELEFPGFTGGNIIWGDYNNDGFLDILFVGGPYPWAGTSTIYKNNGDGTFTLNQNSFLLKLSNGAGAWVDVNNDGLLDIIISGYYQLLQRPETKVYINNGDGTFSQTSNNITGMYYASIACADFDNNGTIDFVISGLDRDFNPTSKLYSNLGNGQFEEVAVNLVGVWQGSAAWGDFNNDGNLDLVIAGKDDIDNNISKGVTKLYRNNGDGTFSEVQTNIAGIFTGSVSWGDYNNDGLLDLLVTGDRKFELFGFDAAFTAIYKNMGNDTFEKADVELPGMINSTGIWADVNNDGNIDILLSGSNNALGIEPFTKLFLNDGSGNFTASEDSLEQLALSVASWGDFNNNGKLDLMLAGYDKDNQTYVTYLYENISSTPNSRPSIPTGLNEEIGADIVKLMWDESFDPETGTESITYNLRVGTSSGASDIYSAMSSQESGLRSIPAFGNTNHNTSWQIRGLEPGEYYWSVQAVDNGFLASEFAAEKTFTIESPTSIDDGIIAFQYELKANYPNPFNPSTRIVYSIPTSEFVTLRVYDVLGRELATLVNEQKSGGVYEINFNASNLSSGIYIYKIQAGNFVESRKMTLMK
ncbi:MAG TPA: T9SS type A sorting domain-containing protein [Ignavibacteriaceae bacterium]|nr:T9SS type A sorting domain-containing protein [Ignavibacteriaceae bacterium]